MRLASCLRQKHLFDVIVVGGGHAGCEAATAASRMGCKTLLMTHRLDTVGEMSCNPSFGGIGKGHLMREIDALDGVCSRVCDISGCHYKVLNRKKGPAVYGLRAQIDRKLFKRNMQNEIFNTPNLMVRAGAVEDLFISNKDSQKNGIGCSKPSVRGVIMADGSIVESKAVVITTGTFLKGEIFMGLESRPAGRIGEDASYGLSKTLDSLGFRLSRLKTGTPPRLDKNTIDFDGLVKHLPDVKATPFSFLSKDVWIPFEEQLPCFLTHSNQKVAEIVKTNVHLNMHVQMETGGPRYCPSLETKILRFGEGKIHQFWLEPEGFDSDVTYPQGMSMTFPPDIQEKIVHSIAGLEKAKVLRHGYGVHYDFVDPRQLKQSLETKLVDGLFLAGQINGTTGYEEAASQGILAGINAGSFVKSVQPLILSRSDSYIGVLVDDLTSLGTSEPYRMFTSRVEFRLHLRPDNADLRLTQMGYDQGVVGKQRYDAFLATKKKYDSALLALISTKFTTGDWMKKFPTGFQCNFPKEKSGRIDLLQFIVAHNNSFDDVLTALGGEYLKFIGDEDLKNRLFIEGTYRNYLRDSAEQIEAVKKQAKLKIPENIDYNSDKLQRALSFECLEKLALHRPQTIGAASRIPGVTPSALVQLFFEIKKLANVSVATAS